MPGPARLVRVVELDRLKGTRCSRPTNPLALRFVGVWIVRQGFVALDGEDIRGEKSALGVTLAFCEIDDEPHAELLPLDAGFRRGLGFSFLDEVNRF